MTVLAVLLGDHALVWSVESHGTEWGLVGLC